MQRKQFTFYRSFLEATQALPKREQLPFLLALIAYALDGEELPLSGLSTSAFCIVKPILDNARRKAEIGKQGGSKPKQSESKTQAKPKQEESKTEANLNLLVQSGKQEKDKEQDKEQVKDEDKDPPTPLEGSSVVGVVVSAVGEIGPKGRAELSGFVDSMGEACVLKALETAQEAGKPTWAYVRGVLRKKRDQGVTCAEQWDRVEARFQSAKGRASGPGTSFQPSTERIQKNSDWLEEFLAGQEGK